MRARAQSKKSWTLLAAIVLIAACTCVTTVAVSLVCLNASPTTTSNKDCNPGENLQSPSRLQKSTKGNAGNARTIRLIKPPPRPDNKTVAICACMREEEKNVDEWVDFHLVRFVEFFLW